MLEEGLLAILNGQSDKRFELDHAELGGLAFRIDQLLNQQEMVIKSMGPLMKRTPCVAGGAVLGNGEVVLVLDVQELEDNFRARTPKAKGLAA